MTRNFRPRMVKTKTCRRCPIKPTAMVRVYSIALACIGPRLSRFEVEFSCSGHIYAVLGDIGDVLAAVKLNRQGLIVYTIK